MSNAPCIANSILNLERKLKIVSKARMANRGEIGLDVDHDVGAGGGEKKALTQDSISASVSVSRSSSEGSSSS